MSNIRIFVVFVVSLLLVACDSKPPIRLAGEAQGTYYSVIYYDAQNRNLQSEIDSILRDFDLTASLWVDSSEICRVNGCADTIMVSARFADLLQKSQQITQLTDGCFDCRIGLLVKAYGFARSNRQDLTQEQIDSLLSICRKPVWLDTVGGRIVLHKSDARQTLDFNAIAQGYSVDILCNYLDQQGIGAYLIDVGGEVRCKGSKPDGKQWQVGIERPAANRDDERTVEVAVAMGSESLVTSGSYRKYYEADGVRYSHTIDPANGRPVQHTTLSTTVIDSTAWLADALATAFMVMGVERSQRWLQQHPTIDEVFFIYDSAGMNAHYATPAFAERLNKEKTK